MIVKKNPGKNLSLMEESFLQLVQSLPFFVVILLIVGSILTLGKGADILVDEAVVLSFRLGLPKIMIGATIVSLGTTLPEASVSVLAAITGRAEMALGNAVGSIICDTGLILGLAILISPPRIEKDLMSRQGFIQLGSGILLVASSLPYSDLGQIFEKGGNLPQSMGIVFVILLAIYIYTSIRWAKKGVSESQIEEELEEKVGLEAASSPWYVFLKLIFGIAVVIVSAKVLIPSVEELANRMEIPKSIISATLVAFGTSLPELVTAIVAAKKGHSELALGNVIGADILNVLFVAGTAAAVTPGGLRADPTFFLFFYPAMLFVILVFRLSALFSKERLDRPVGLILLATYILVTILSYLRNMQ